MALAATEAPQMIRLLASILLFLLPHKASSVVVGPNIYTYGAPSGSPVQQPVTIDLTIAGVAGPNLTMKANTAGNVLVIKNSSGTVNFLATDTGSFTANAASTINAATNSGLNIALSGSTNGSGVTETGVVLSLRSAGGFAEITSDDTGGLARGNERFGLNSTHYGQIYWNNTLSGLALLSDNGATGGPFFFTDLNGIGGLSVFPNVGVTALTMSSYVASGANTAYTWNTQTPPNTFAQFQNNGTGFFTVGGAQPASSSSAGTNAIENSWTGPVGGATTGSATTAGKGSGFTFTGGLGGSGSGGTNATGGVGGDFSVSCGNGGASSGTALGGAGGAVSISAGVGGVGAFGGNLTLSCGNGGSSSGAGGTITINLAQGGTSSGSGVGGTGGALTIGNSATQGGGSSTSGNGGNAGAWTFSSGNGGTTSGTGTTGGNAASISISTGNGGSGSSGTNASGGTGGAISFTSGVGGTASGTGTVGAPGGFTATVGGLLSNWNGIAKQSVSSTSISTSGAQSCGSTITSAANGFVAGKVIRVHAFGIYTSGGTPGNITWFLKGGSVTLCTTSAAAIIASQTNMGWSFDGWIVCQTIGSSGTFMSGGNATMDESSITTLPFINYATTTSAVTLSTATTEVFDLQVNMSTASGDTVTVQSVTWYYGN